MSVTHKRLRPYYFLVAGVLLQGLSPVFTKLLLLEGLSRACVVSSRYVLAVALLLPFGGRNMGGRQAKATPRPRDWVALFFVGALGSGVAALLFTAALDYSSAGIVNSISKTAPIFVAFFSYLILSERVTFLRILLVGAMVGADALIGLGELSFSAQQARTRLLGDGLALMAGITRASAEILAKNALKRFAASTVTLWRFGIGALVTGGVAVYNGTYSQVFGLDTRGFIILACLAGVSTSLSMFLYYRGTSEIPVHVAVSLKILGAIVTIIVSWIVLNETLNLYHVAGMGVLISGGYLLVRRTAHPSVPDEARAAQQEPAEPETSSTTKSSSSSGQLRTRLILLVGAVVLAVVIVATVLSVTYTQKAVRKQIRLTMGKVASTIVQLTRVEPPPSTTTIQEYADSIVRHEIESDEYSIEIIYIAVVDENSNVIAFAVDEDIALFDQSGNKYHSGDLQAAQGLLALSAQGQLARRHDIIPVRARLQEHANTSSQGFVEIGCRRSVANKLLAKIAARNVLLVLLLAAIGIAIAMVWIRRITNPVERLAMAMERISGGELELPVVSETAGAPELQQMGDSLESMRERLRTGNAMRRGFVHYVARAISEHIGITRPPHETREREIALLAIDLSAGAGADDDEKQAGQIHAAIDAIVAGVVENDGQFASHRGTCIVAYWSIGGLEGGLWAALTAIQIKQRLQAIGERTPTVCGVDICSVPWSEFGPASDSIEGVCDIFKPAAAITANAQPIIATDRAMDRIGQQFEAEKLNDRLWELQELIQPPSEFADIAGADMD